MYIGFLKYGEPVFTHAGCALPFLPTAQENGTYTWDWEVLFDTALDVTLPLEQLSFVGAVSLALSENSVTKAEVLVNGATVGVHTAETGKLTGGAITLPVGAQADALTLRLYANMKNVTLESISILGAHDDGKPFVWPNPKSMTLLGGQDPIASIQAASEDADECYAAAFLRSRLAERHGWEAQENGVRVVLKKDCSEAYSGERYTVDCENGTVTVTAASRLTLLYGTDTLLQLSTKEGLPRVAVDDRPSKSLRGLHIGLPARENFEYVRRMLRYMLIPLRYNMLIVQFTGGMRLDKHPEINDGWARAAQNAKAGLQPRMPHSGMVTHGTILEKAEVNEILDSMREIGIEIVPEIQSFGHVQYITYVHPELAERIEKPESDVDARNDDIKPVGFYPHCYCPSLQASYDLIYDIIDEIVEVVKPTRYVHMGHDEIYHIGQCSLCRTKSKADLYVQHVTAMYDYLKKKGLKTMLWSDMPHADPARKYYVPDARGRLPKDILMLDFVWYFRPEQDVEDELLPFGYPLAIGNLYSSHFTRYRSRITKDGVLGGQLSLWADTDEAEAAVKGKWWDMIYLANMLWNPEDYEQENRTTYSYLLAKHIQPEMRESMRQSYCKNGYRATALPMPTGANPAFSPLSAITPSAVLWKNGSITVNAAYDRLVFAHATAHGMPIYAWDPPCEVGSYLVAYADGTEERVPVLYGGNVMRYDYRYGEPMPNKYYRHTGYVGTWFSDPLYQGHDEKGSPLCVLACPWENPHPEKIIASVSYEPSTNGGCSLILAGIVGETKNQ